MPIFLNAVNNYRNYRYVAEIIFTGSNWLDRVTLCQDIRSWLVENQIPNREHSTDAAWFFETRSDAMLFILRWDDNV